MLSRYVKNFDYILISVIIILSLFGLIMVYSSSMIVATEGKFQGESNLFFLKQAKWVAIGIVLMFGTMIIPYQAWNKTKLLFYSIGVLFLMLLGLFIAGTASNNALSWFKLGVASFQPAELVKIVIIVYLASVISKKQRYINHMQKSIIPLFAPVIILVGLIFIQPDAGTAMIILAVVIMIITCSGINLKNVLKLYLFFAALIGIAIFFLSEEQWSRIFTVFHPLADPLGDGYQLTNSLQAISLGGFQGLGFGQSIQKYGYLPEPYTDFILAIISEELGFFGVFFVLICLFTIIARAFVLARKCQDNFGSLLALGIGSLIFIQTFVNVGGLLGIIPLTGVTLPFVSYGGSSYATLMIAMGFLVNISTQVRMVDAGISFSRKEETFKKKGNVTYLES